MNRLGNIKVEFEVRGFGEEQVENMEDSYKSVEIARTKRISKLTTLGELESMLNELFDEVGEHYENPEQLLGKITIRAKKEKDLIKYLG